MSVVAKPKQDAKAKQVTQADINVLDTITQQSADAVRPYLRNATIENYQHFLRGMYYYTLTSGDKLRVAMENSKTEELRKYFEHMLKEEKSHYVLAREDYRAFGKTINEADPTPPVIQAFNDYWTALGNGHNNGYLGTLYVAENVAKYLAQDAIDMIARLQLSKKQYRWIAVHLEADVGHGNEVKEMCQKYFAEDPQAMVQAAQAMCKHWADIMNFSLGGAV